MNFMCSKGHTRPARVSENGEPCSVELRDKGGHKFRTPKWCDDPLYPEPEVIGCPECSRGIMVEGTCSFCGARVLAPPVDVWQEKGYGYGYKGNDPLLPKLLAAGLTAAEMAEYSA